MNFIFVFSYALKVLEIKLENLADFIFEFIIKTLVFQILIFIVNEGFLKVLIVVIVHLTR